MAKQSCIAAFPELKPQRVAQAYEWVQMLVNYYNAPLLPDDNLWADLQVDQGDADDLYESAHEWSGAASSSVKVPTNRAIETVRDLMAEVLDLGYEGYVSVLTSSRRNSAA